MDKLPAQATDLERLVLGACLMQMVAIEDLKLSKEMFYLPVHQTVFNAILECDKRGSCDIFAVQQYLQDNNKLDEIGGPAWLIGLTTLIGTKGQVFHYARVIIDKFIERQTAIILYKGYLQSQSSDDYINIIENVKKDLTDLIPSSIGENSFLITKTANEWIMEASKRPIPKMLFSEFWHETEFCIFFATAGNGKSALSVQIGNSIASGIPVPGFRMEAEPQYVLYFDFEISDKIFEQRYSNNFTDHFVFDDKFIRVEINPEADKPEKMTIEEFLISSMEKCIIKYNAKILIVDNITYLSADSEKAKEALPLMKKLKGLKRKYDLSILGLTHTPKRDESKPIGKNDLFGSSMIYNFCDSCFAIGKSSSDESLRYLKQLKERFTAKIYDTDNVVIMQIEKPSNHLQLTQIGFGKEIDYLKNISENDKQVMKEMVQQRHREGKSYREIAREFNISLSKVQRILKPELSVTEITPLDPLNPTKIKDENSPF